MGGVGIPQSTQGVHTAEDLGIPDILRIVAIGIPQSAREGGRGRCRVQRCATSRSGPFSVTPQMRTYIHPWYTWVGFVVMDSPTTVHVAGTTSFSHFLFRPC